MRKLLVLLITLCFVTSSAFAAFSGNSVRMQGINPNLVGIMADEYSDAITINTSDLLNVEGWRVYTNFSNLYNDQFAEIGNDRALNGATTGGVGATSFLLGAFGNPLKGGLLPDSQMGLLLDANSAITPMVNQLGGNGESVDDDVTQDDNNADGDYNDVGDWTRIIKQKASRQFERGQMNLNVLYAHKLTDELKLGLNITKSDLVNNTPNSSESIDSSYSRDLTTIGTPTTLVTQDHSQTAKETIKNSSMLIGISARYQLSDKLNIGGGISINPISTEQTRESKVTIKIDNTAGAAQPITAEATMVDGTLNAIPGGYGTDASGVTAGFDWTTAGLFGNLGFDVNTDDVGTAKMSGSGIGLSVNPQYQLTDELKLSALLTYNSAPSNITADLSLPYTETLRSAFVAGDSLVTDNNTKNTFKDCKNKNDTIGLQAGGEAKLKENVLLGFGLVYMSNTNKTDGTGENSVRNVMTYDAQNNGFTNDGTSGDMRVTITDKNTFEFVFETKTDTIQLPIGMEMRPWKKFPVRLGVTHRIQTTKTTNTMKTTKDELAVTVTETGGATITTYEATGPGKQTSDEATTIVTTHVRITQYYYGIGYEWSENLTFDILGIASGVSILDLSAWRIGATLKF